MHSVRVSYGSDGWVWISPFGPIIKLILPMFFALSGFLVTNSLQQTKTLGVFFGLRILRIYPALVVEVILSAFILGAVYTTDPLREYFSSKEFFLYLMNITGIIHFYLPGVFMHNPDARYVNVQLWTVPFELKCIILLSLLMLLGVKRWRILAPVAAFMMMFAVAMQRYRLTHSLLIGVGNAGTPGPFLMVCFLFGVSLYLYRERIPYSLGLFVVSLLICLVSNHFGSFGDNFNAPFVAYITAYLGLRSPKKILLLKGADYSYGIYLYGYPIQQTFATFGNWTHHWYLSILFCLPVAALFAATSWRYIEKPALGLKSQLYKLESVYLTWKATPSLRKLGARGVDVDSAA
jgi:peptidoglycan/LPS O-acetylase OafA/YrhL